MKNLIAVLAFMMLGQAQAQTQAAQPVVVYDETTNSMVEVQPQAQSQPQPTQSPIYIMNSQKYQGYQGATQAQVQEQPMTVVQESPLAVSPAENMRRKRQDVEAATEDGIVQALEKARMEDEIRRREKFNGAIGTGSEATQPSNTIVQPIMPQQQLPPPVVVAPAAPIVTVVEERREEKPEEEKVDVRTEVRAALAEANAEKPADTSNYYISGLVGMGKYPDVVNVRGNVVTGFALGMVTNERVVAEGSFMYGEYELENIHYSGGYNPYGSNFFDIRQYNISAALKYQLLPGKLRPNVGAVVSYTRRTFTDFYDFELRNSDAFDAGLLAGIDLQLTDSLAIGFDFRYLMNVAFREDSQHRQSFVYPRALNQVEEQDYYMGSLAAKFTF